MKLKFVTFLVACLFIASISLKAQTISGKISDATQKPLEGASVYLMQDSILVKTALADAEGRFLFDKLKQGNYRINITMIGFASYKSELLKPDAVVTIVLQPASKELNEVVVTTKKQFVEQKIDRTVINVDALISNAGSTALDVLEKSPGVTVEQNGVISLKGKGGVKIFIDDKPTYLSGADLENYLRSLSSATVDQIELMSNPPAKYDAAGNGGVINIRLKRNKAKGFNGGINVSYIQGKYSKTNNGLNFTYRNNNINIFGNVSFNVANGFSDLDINRHFFDEAGNPTSDFLQNSFIRRISTSNNVKLGFDYYLGKKDIFGMVINGLSNVGDVNTLNKSRLFNVSGILDSTIVAVNKENRNFKNGGINFNYRHQYNDKGRELTADLDYLRYQTRSKQSFDNTGYLLDNSVSSHDLLTGNLPSNINIWSAKTDYSHPLSNGVKLETGLKSSFTETDNIADYFYTVDNVTTPDYNKTNHFIYKEQINAGYLNASKDWKRFAVQLGLRFENTVSNGHQLGNIQKPDSTFKRNYNGLFPTFYLQYKLDTAGNQTIGFDYGRRIDRPYYEDLNPFLSPLDKFTYYTGNPFLRPSYTDNLELTHTWKNITTTLSYNKTKDDVNETIEIVNGIYYSRPGNLGTVTSKGISVDASFDITKWFNFHLFMRATNIHTNSTFYTGTLNTQGTFYFIRPIFQFKLQKGWTAQLDGGYQSKVTNAQFIASARGRVNMAVTKKLSPSATLSLVGNDLFYNFRNAGEINNLANTKANYLNLSDTRTIVLSFSYRFGKAISNLRKHNANGAESEQNRVKN